MTEPRGPLPSSVYRRRRITAIVGTGLGVVLVVWGVGAMLDGNDVPNGHGAAAVRAAGARLNPSARASNPPTRGSVAARGTARGQVPSSAASPSPVPATTAVTTTTAPPPPPQPPGPPQPCPDAVMAVAVTTTQPAFRVGQRPTFTLHITNTGPVACVRDVSRPLRAIQLFAAGSTTPLWSSGDCFTLGAPDTRTLAAGQSLAYGIAWAGRSSAPGCPGARAVVPAGTYTLVGHLGPLASPPVPLTLTP